MALHQCQGAVPGPGVDRSVDTGHQLPPGQSARQAAGVIVQPTVTVLLVPGFCPQHRTIAAGPTGGDRYHSVTNEVRCACPFRRGAAGPPHASHPTEKGGCLAKGAPVQASQARRVSDALTPVAAVSSTASRSTTMRVVPAASHSPTRFRALSIDRHANAPSRVEAGSDTRTRPSCSVAVLGVACARLPLANRPRGPIWSPWAGVL